MGPLQVSTDTTRNRELVTEYGTSCDLYWFKANLLPQDSWACFQNINSAFQLTAAMKVLWNHGITLHAKSRSQNVGRSKKITTALCKMEI